MRYFVSAGEASGELAAAALAREIRTLDPNASFEAIGGERSRAAGFAIVLDNRGWASLGPWAAIPKIPRLLAGMHRAAAHVAASKPDEVILVDFGAFNVRFAQRLRKIGYRGAIVDLFPPGAWLDRAGAARAVAQAAIPVTAFARQRDFYRSLNLPVQYFGHPLTGEYAMRPPRAAPPADGGVVALLPGSRAGELRRHVPIAGAAARLLRASRPKLRFVSAAPDSSAARILERRFAREGLNDVAIVSGASAAAAQADVAIVASGTAVLECALTGVPSVVFYRTGALLAAYVRRIYRGRFIALPNVVLEREALPEFVQEAATPGALAAAAAQILNDPASAYAALADFQSAIGPRDALAHIARLCVDVACGAAC